MPNLLIFLFIVLGIGTLSFLYGITKDRDDFTIIGIIVGLCGLFGSLVGFIEYLDTGEEFNSWKKERGALEITLLSIDQVKDSDNLLYIYELIKDSNDKLTFAKKKWENKATTREWYDRRYLEYTSLTILKDDDGQTIKYDIREEQINEEE